MQTKNSFTTRDGSAILWLMKLNFLSLPKVGHISLTLNQMSVDSEFNYADPRPDCLLGIKNDADRVWKKAYL